MRFPLGIALVCYFFINSALSQYPHKGPELAQGFVPFRHMKYVDLTDDVIKAGLGKPINLTHYLENQPNHKLTFQMDDLTRPLPFSYQANHWFIVFSMDYSRLRRYFLKRSNNLGKIYQEIDTNDPKMINAFEEIIRQTLKKPENAAFIKALRKKIIERLTNPIVSVDSLNATHMEDLLSQTGVMDYFLSSTNYVLN